jgi:hypothetical protein
LAFPFNNRIKLDNLKEITPLKNLGRLNCIDYLYSMFNQAFQRNTSWQEQRASATIWLLSLRLETLLN